MDAALGEASSRSWAELFVIADLGSLTAKEALDAGVPPKKVWAAVWDVLNLPDRDR